MKKSSAMAFLVLGIAAFVGIIVLFYGALPGIVESGSIILVTVLVIAVEAALFMLGVFVGRLYGRSSRSRKIIADMRDRFRGALNFERKERLRLERNLQEAKQTMISLEDRVGSHQNVTQKPIVRISKEETGQMKSEIVELTKRHDRMSSDLINRKERIADLMAELSVAQSEAEKAKSEAETLRASGGTSQLSTRFSFDGESIKEILDDIVALEGVKMALVADDYGLVVEAVGEGLPSDTVAAISNLVERLGPQVREILPMGEVTSVSLGDDQGLVLDTRYFDLFGVRCALAIARYEDFPYPGLAKKAIESVVSSMDE
ncbi:MAG: hypothetical protein GY762_13590 [Proteobacteria bacterium]|nr:hypothetical protein [Pseudomonadota bacterium]